MSQLSWLDPYTNAVQNNIMVALADKTEMKTLHMVTVRNLSGLRLSLRLADPDLFSS